MSHGYVHPLPVGDWTIIGTFRRRDSGTVVETLDEYLEIRIRADGRVGWRVGESAFVAPAGGETVTTISLRRRARTVEFSVDGGLLACWSAAPIVGVRSVRLTCSNDGGGGDLAVYSMALADDALERLHRDAHTILPLEPAAA